MIEYELIQQQARELRAHAEHERLVREAKPAKRAGWRPNVRFRTERRAVRPREC